MTSQAGERMKGRIVYLDDDSTHLVTSVSAHPVRGRMLNLFPLEGKGEHREIPISEARILHDSTKGGEGAILRTLLANRKAQESGGGGLALRCNSMFKPFQFRPLVKFQGESDGRLLIADETGLGKTIETGYILVEEFAAGRANRVLLMVPARSMGKWRREMRSRFGIILEEATRKRITECVNDPSQTFHLICSHDVGRQTKHWWDELSGSLDLLVIDEVHNHIGTNSVFRRPMAEALSDASESMVGLTATPVRRDAGDLFRILELISPGITQGLDQDREMRLLSVTNSLTRALESEDERESRRLCDELDGILPAAASDPGHPRAMISQPAPWDPREIAASVRYLRGLPTVSRHITRARGRDPEIDEHNPRVVHPTHWIEPVGSEEDAISQIDDLLSREFYHIHRQQLASCRPAMLELMSNGTLGLRTFHRDFQGGSGPAPTPVPGPVEEECTRMVSLLRRIRGSDDAKFAELEAILEEMRGDPSVTKAVVFTHFHPTFRYLKKRLEQLGMVQDGVRLVLADPTDDDERLQSLNDELMGIDGFAVLLATDRMSEAVDLHAANSVINYDMPYNPQDLQQRIGRVDRIVQEADGIHVHNLAVRGTVDDAIMARIVDRSRIFEAMVGGMEAVASEMSRAFLKRPEVEDALGGLEDELDQRRLVEGGEEFRLVDRVFDDSIKEARLAQSPFLSREHIPILAAFERLRPGAGHSWDEESRKLRLAVDHDLAAAIFEIVGRNDLGPEMMFELTMASKTGTLSLEVGGSSATLGPAHRFNHWVTDMLSHAEGCEAPISERSPDGPPGGAVLVKVEGSMTTDSTWLVEPDGTKLGDWLDRIGSSDSPTAIGPLSGDSSGSISTHPDVQALIDRDRAEHERLRQARIRRMHAIRRRLEPDDDDPKVASRLARIIQELDDLQSMPAPEPATAVAMHEYRAEGR